MYLCAVNNTKPIIMPRQERQQSATGIYHVMLRGINKQWIMSARLCRFALQRTVPDFLQKHLVMIKIQNKMEDYILMVMTNIM